MISNYTFVIPSEPNHLDPEVPLHSISCWRNSPDPMVAEPTWFIQYRFDDETMYQTTAGNHNNAMIKVAYMLEAALVQTLEEEALIVPVNEFVNELKAHPEL